ncbi:RNA methyltransferase [Methylosinus sporium]|uniref:RNA methyltransferase n=2 Tax=Methylosinus sporium TaxID=428 RepID=A0A2U1SP55_METSR|nr:RNA methyltransferase [Methylosinus sporium]
MRGGERRPHMAYDPDLVSRLHALFAARDDVEPRRMFGGLCFLLKGNMCVAVRGDSLILRLGEEGARLAATREHVAPAILGGRVMKGWATAAPAALRSDAALAELVGLAVAFVETLQRAAADQKIPSTRRRAGAAKSTKARTTGRRKRAEG